MVKFKKSWVVTTVFSVCATLFFVIGFIYYQQSSIVAVVNGNAISKDDYQKRKIAEENFIEFSYVDDANLKTEKLKNVAKDTLEKLIEEKIVYQVANEKSISVSDEEIRQKETVLVKAYNTESEYEDILDSVYKQTRDQVRENLRFRILKDKVSKEAIDKRTVSYIYVRYDLTGQENNPEVTQSEVEKLSEEKAKEYLKKVSLEGFDKISLQAQKDSAETFLVLGFDEYKNIDQKIELAPEDIEAIWSLEVGNTSDLVKSSGGYYAIYRLENKTSGNYSNYQEFISSEKKKRNVRVYLPEASEGSGFISDLSTIFFGIAGAAGCDDCSGAKGVKWYGKVTDSVTGNAISGVSMKVENTGSGISCLDSTTGHGWCGPKSGTETTNTDGYYQFGRVDGKNVFVNCGWSGDWKLTASKSGFQDFSNNYNIKGKNGGVFEVNISMVADAWDDLSVTLRANPQEFEVDYYVEKNVTFTAKVNHKRGPDSHGIEKYEWDLDGNGAYEKNIASGVITNSYGWIDTDEKKINVKVKVTCNKGRTAEALVVLTLKRPPHEIVCKTISAEPRTGIVPLTVRFNAFIVDTWGFPIIKYKWDFDGDGNWDRETANNITSYTYDQRGGFTVSVIGENNQNLPVRGCPMNANVLTGNWLDSDWIEVAP